MKYQTTNIGKIFIILLLSLILLSPLSYATGTYSLPTATEEITVHDNGLTSITDSITYSIEGEVNGVTRIIPLSGEQKLTNLEVETPGFYNTLEVEDSGNAKTIKVWLYADEAKQHKVSDKDVNVIFKYNIEKGVKVYNDIAEFQYMSWGSGWNKELNSLTTHITIPGSKDNTQYWNNPNTYTKDSSWTTDNILTSNFANIPEKTSIEQRILFPKEYITSTQYADVINKDAKNQIENDQKEYANREAFNNTLSFIPSIISVILLIAPIGMYLKWGRDPKIIYRADYESQIPTDDSPVFINAMIPQIVEELSTDAFSATLLDLIDRRYYKLVISNKEDTIIRRLEKDTGQLKQHEIDIIEFLKGYENDKKHISLAEMSEDSYSLQKFYNAWKIDAMKDVPINRVRRYYDKSKENIMSGYNILAIFLACVFIAYLAMFATGPAVMIGIILAVILIIEQAVIFLFVDSPLGTWTKEGKEFHDKWKNYEKYIKDFSLIKERPPESIQVWGQILVYATALGCAEEVTKNMKQYIKTYNIDENMILNYDVLTMGYLFGFYHMNRTFNTGMNNPDFGSTGFDTGSFGDIGGPGSGGFGGGGGGVF